MHGRDPPAAEMTGDQDRPGRAAPPRTPAWRVALSLFTVIPAGVGRDLDDTAAARAVFWLPVLGAGLGLAGAGAMVLVAAGGGTPERQLLGAALAMMLLALLTGGLHLDGLADTADGLGSRRPADQALEIMRRSDAGPFGVAALVLVLLIQVCALASLPPRAGRGRPGAGRGDQPGRRGAGHRVAVGAAVRVRRAGGRPDQCHGPGGQRGAAAGRGGGGRAGPGRPAGRGPGRGGRGAGLGVAAVLRRAARRRLGGLTGDVFGAIIELSTATVLLVLVLAR